MSLETYGVSKGRLKTGPKSDSHKVMHLLLDAIQFFLYLHEQQSAANINLTWERKCRPSSSALPSGQGFVTLSKVLANALRVILAKPLISGNDGYRACPGNERKSSRMFPSYCFPERLRSTSGQ